MSKGIDVSRHQGKIDWRRVKEVIGLNFAVIRASCSKHTDERLALNINGCIENNIPFGFYHTLYADTIEMAKQEAQIFLTSIKGYSPEFPIFVDVEFWTETDEKTNIVTWTNRNLSKRLWTDMVITFCEICEKAGYYVGVYASKSFIENTLIYEELKQYDFWLAQWDVTSPTWGGQFGLWQNVVEENAQQYGVQSDRLDFDVAYKDYPSIIRNAGLNGFTTAQPTPQPEPVAPVPQPAPIPDPVPPVHNIAVGNMVTINNGAKTYTGGNVDSWVYAQNRHCFEVYELNGERAVLDRNGINTPFNVKDLKFFGNVAKPVNPPTPQTRTYTILPGESFCRISAKIYGTESRAADIAYANGMTLQSTIFAGKTLILPD